MLVLSRKANQSIVVGDDVRIVVVGIDRDHVKLGIEAPRSISVHRAEELLGSRQTGALKGRRTRRP